MDGKGLQLILIICLVESHTVERHVMDHDVVFESLFEERINLVELWGTGDMMRPDTMNPRVKMGEVILRIHITFPAFFKFSLLEHTDTNLTDASRIGIGSLNIKAIEAGVWHGVKIEKRTKEEGRRKRKNVRSEIGINRRKLLS